MLRKFPKHTTAGLCGGFKGFTVYEVTVSPTVCASFHTADGVYACKLGIERVGFAVSEFVHEGVSADVARELPVKPYVVAAFEAECAGFGLWQVKIGN